MVDNFDCSVYLYLAVFCVLLDGLVAETEQ